MSATSTRPNRVSRARRTVMVAVGLLLLGAGQRARGQSSEATALYDEGHRLLQAGRLAEACEAFEASNRVLPGAGTYLYLGECRERNGQLASAWSAYKATMDRARDPAKIKEARTKVNLLGPRLSHLTVSVPDGIRVADLEITRDGAQIDPMLWNRALPIDGGDYVIVASAPGYEPWQTTVHVPVEHGEVTIEVPSLAPSPVALTVSAESRVPWSAKRKLAVGSAATSVLAITGGVLLGISARGKQDEARRLCPDRNACQYADQADALYRSGHNRAIAANVSFGLAGATAIAAAVLWITGGRSSKSDIAVVPVASTEQIGITAMGRF